eukprot:GHVP01037536.1.p1 GENE.GHVP01037536.1~~GHVP01037536.1.p1  ORF type:complete len:284 (+),score=62.61 GHVP01037536.1:379-1230(+)
MKKTNLCLFFATVCASVGPIENLTGLSPPSYPLPEEPSQSLTKIRSPSIYHPATHKEEESSAPTPPPPSSEIRPPPSIIPPPPNVGGLEPHPVDPTEEESWAPGYLPGDIKENEESISGLSNLFIGEISQPLRESSIRITTLLDEIQKRWATVEEGISKANDITKWGNSTSEFNPERFEYFLDHITNQVEVLKKLKQLKHEVIGKEALGKVDETIEGFLRGVLFSVDSGMENLNPSHQNRTGTLIDEFKKITEYEKTSIEALEKEGKIEKEDAYLTENLLEKM